LDVAVSKAADAEAGSVSGIDPRVDPAAWVANNQRITHDAALEEWLALYTEDAVLESIVDGGLERHEGIDEIRHAAGILVAVFAARHIRVDKQLVSGTQDAVVNSWTGGFDGRHNQRGVEIWELRGPLVRRHRMYTFLDVRPAESLRARMRAMVGGELRVKLTLLRVSARP
jgi:hypothetical protein